MFLTFSGTDFLHQLLFYLLSTSRQPNKNLHITEGVVSQILFTELILLSIYQKESYNYLFHCTFSYLEIVLWLQLIWPAR